MRISDEFQQAVLAKVGPGVFVLLFSLVLAGFVLLVAAEWGPK